MNTQQEPDSFDSLPRTPSQYPDNNQVKINYNPLPRPALSDTVQTQVSDSASSMSDDDGQRRTPVTDSVGHRETQTAPVADKLPELVAEDEERDVGHDPDLPARGDRHGLSTYEAARIFEEAECRVSERTIIRWCNKNKRGTRRLDCAFDTDEHKYYIAEDSVKTVIRDERSKGRQSEQYNPDLSDIEDVSNTNDRHASDNVGHQSPTMSDDVGRRRTPVSDSVGQQAKPDETREPTKVPEQWPELTEENMRLQILVAKLEEQGKTKDEMMTFLRKEIDRRGEQVMQDRETYNQSLDWFRTQVESKDTVIERLNTQMRGLLEAPRAPSRERETGTNQQDEPTATGHVREVPREEPTEYRSL